MSPKEMQNYKDFIDYEPEVIRYIDQEESRLINKYSIIMNALRDKNMTVKEIHDLYFDDEIKKHACTLKTIYRYLKRLEKANFVTVAGHRMREGSRQTEKIYSKTAKIFLAKKDKEYLSKKITFRRSLSKNVSTLLKEAFNKTNKESEEFQKIMLELLDKNHKVTDEILDNLLKNEELINLYAETQLDEMQLVNIYEMFLITWLKYPELYKNAMKLFV